MNGGRRGVAEPHGRSFKDVEELFLGPDTAELHDAMTRIPGLSLFWMVRFAGRASVVERLGSVA